ncbi:MAG: Gp15 family bacteriophage protein [Oscillospiraceae bacterium]
MIGKLPTSLEIGGKQYEIRSDYRVILNIYQAFNDPDLTDREKCYVCLKCLYEDFDSIPQEDIQEAIDKAYWFVGGGNIPQENVQQAKTIDWEQDESIIFPAVSKVAGYEVRSVAYLYWWVFLGLFNEIGEGLFSEVISIRSKLNKGKPLEKWEREFYNLHKNLITLKEKKSAQQIAEEKEDEEFINQLIGLS